MLFWSFHAREDRQRIHKGCKKTMKSEKRSWQLGLLPGGLPEKVTLILSSGPAYTETGEGSGVAEGSGMDQQESPRQREQLARDKHSLKSPETNALLWAEHGGERSRTEMSSCCVGHGLNKSHMAAMK